MQLTTTTTATTAADQRAADEASQFSRLPLALLTRILQAVPQRERLTSCAVVCKSWAAAATAATVEVEHGPAPGAFPGFQPWLQQHASQLVLLKLQPHHGKLYPVYEAELNLVCKLPCQEMQHLSRPGLWALELELHMPADTGSSGSSSSRAAAPMFPKLKELNFNECKLSRSTLQQLAQVSTITYLELRPADCGAEARVDSDAVKQLLQGLPNLAHVSLAHVLDDADWMPALPAASLTALSLGVPWTGRHERPKPPDSTSRLVQLRLLELCYAECNLASLASMTLLTQLNLRGCLPSAGLDAAAAGSAFLAAVHGMPHLQHLEVLQQVFPSEDYEFDAHDEPGLFFLSAARPCDCAALTVSSQLTCLQIYSEQTQPLPATALQHMFPACKQLPRLQRLMLSTDVKGAGHISTAELRSVVGACPALHWLGLQGVLVADVDVAVLLELPSTCRSLAVGGAAIGDSAVPVIAQLTQLTSLYWGGSPGLTCRAAAADAAAGAADILVASSSGIPERFLRFPAS